MSITVTAKQLREALEYANPDENDEDQEETLITIAWMEKRIAIDGEYMAEGYYLYFTEYPEEGVIGPL